MGTPINPDPEDGGFDCGSCRQEGELFEHGMPDHLRFTYSGISGCPPYINPPDGPYILTQMGALQPCTYKLIDRFGVTHLFGADFDFGNLLAWFILGIEGYEYFHYEGPTCSFAIVNSITGCNYVARPRLVGVGGYAAVESAYPTDPQYYAYGAGLFPDRSMHYDSGPCDDGDTWFRFCAVRDRINCMVKGNTAEV